MDMYMCACNSTCLVVRFQLVVAGSPFTKWVVGLELRSSDLYLLSYLFGSHKQGSLYLTRRPFPLPGFTIPLLFDGSKTNISNLAEFFPDYV